MDQKIIPMYQLAIAGEQPQNLIGINNKNLFLITYLWVSCSDSYATCLQISWSGSFGGPG